MSSMAWGLTMLMISTTLLLTGTEPSGNNVTGVPGTKNNKQLSITHLWRTNKLVSWSLTSLFSTNMAISETREPIKSYNNTPGYVIRTTTLTIQRISARSDEFLSLLWRSNLRFLWHVNLSHIRQLIMSIKSVTSPPRKAEVKTSQPSTPSLLQQQECIVQHI